MKTPTTSSPTQKTKRKSSQVSTKSLATTPKKRHIDLKIKKKEKIDHLSSDSFTKLSKKSLSQNLPFFYAEKTETNPLKKYSCKDLFPDSSRLMHQRTKDIRLKDNTSLDQYNFFIIYPDKPEGVLLGNGIDVLKSEEDYNLFLDCSLFLTDPEEEKPKTIPYMAGLFFSGETFPQNKPYAKKLIKLITDPVERKMSLADGLVASSRKEKDLLMLMAFLELGADVNQRFHNGGVALPTALFHGNDRAAEILTKAGASLDTDDYRYGRCVSMI